MVGCGLTHTCTKKRVASISSWLSGRQKRESLSLARCSVEKQRATKADLSVLFFLLLFVPRPGTLSSRPGVDRILRSFSSHFLIRWVDPVGVASFGLNWHLISPVRSCQLCVHAGEHDKVFKLDILMDMSPLSLRPRLRTWSSLPEGGSEEITTRNLLSLPPHTYWLPL